MAVAWGTAANVKVLLDNMTGKTNTQIEQIIEQCEGFFKAILKIPDTFTFDSAEKEHLLLRTAVESRAAILSLTIASHNSIEEVHVMYDMLYEMYTDAKKFLVDPQNRGVWDYVEEA